MRIGIVTTWFERGAAMVSRAYREVLVGQGHEVFIYARGGEHKAKGDPNWDGEYVTWDEGSRVWNSLNWDQFRGWVRRTKLDVLFFNEQKYWPVVLFARREFGIPVGSYVDYYTAATVPLFAFFDFLICNTRRHAGVFEWHPQAIYIPWGTDCKAYQGNCQPVDPPNLVFFHSAGMNPVRKGTDIVVKAFLGLKASARLVLHVQAPIGNFPELARLATSDSRIEVINRTAGVPGLYHLGDVYVYPTILDGIGLSIVEALACGLPVITTDCAPMNEFVQDGVNGRLVRPSEYRGRVDGYYWAESYCRAADVQAAMEYYVSQVDSLPEYKRRARESAERSLDWSRNAAGLGKAFERARRQSDSGAELKSLEKKALALARQRLPWPRRALIKMLSRVAPESGLGAFPRLYC